MTTFDGDILQCNKSHCSETQTWDVSGQILPEEMSDKSEKVQVHKEATRIDRLSLGSDGCAQAGAFFILDLLGLCIV